MSIIYSDSSIKLVWENNPDTSLNASNLSKSFDYIASYMNFDYDSATMASINSSTDNSQITSYHSEGQSILIREESSGSGKYLRLKRGTVIGLINTQVDASGNKILGENENYRVFDVGLDDIILSPESKIGCMDNNPSNPSGTWGVSKEWFVYLCDKMDDSLVKESSDDYGGGAQILISTSRNYPIGAIPGYPTINYSANSVRKIGGFKSDANGNIIATSVWDISQCHTTIRAHDYYFFEEYAKDSSDNSRFINRRLRLSDLDSASDTLTINNSLYVCKSGGTTNAISVDVSTNTVTIPNLIVTGTTTSQTSSQSTAETITTLTATTANITTSNEATANITTAKITTENTTTANLTTANVDTLNINASGTLNVTNSGSRANITTLAATNATITTANTTTANETTANITTANITDLNLASGIVEIANYGATSGVFNGIQGTIGDNDQWFIGGSQTATNTGYMEIATGDDGAEPIYFRQYVGVPHSTVSTSGSVARTLTILDGSGNTTLPGSLNVPTINLTNCFTSDVKIIKSNAWLTVQASSGSSGITFGGAAGSSYAMGLSYTTVDGCGHIGLGAYNSSTLSFASDAIRFSSSSMALINNLTIGSSGILASNNTSPSGSAVLGYNGYFYATRVYNAVWNDLAEFFLSDENAEYGKIYYIGEDGKIKKTIKRAMESVIGVASDTPGFVLKSEYEDKGGIAIGLSGSVRVWVKEKIKSGTELVCDKDGFASPATLFEKIFKRGAIVGKAIESNQATASKRILMLVK